MSEAAQANAAKPVPGGNTVLVEFDDGIAWVTLNRPEKRNAISPTLAAEMLSVLDALEIDDRAGVVVITGAGDAYCAGMDLKEFFRATDGMKPEQFTQYSRLSSAWQWRRLHQYMKPTIIMVNGWCFGAGFNSVIAGDIAIAADEAVFGLSEVNWGMIPAGNVLKSVVSVMNHRDAMYYSMTGNTFDGRRAQQMGMVNESVPRAELRARVTELARDLLSKNQAALRAIKHATRKVREMSWDDAEDYLFAKLDQMRFHDAEKGREKGMKQFLDDKTYRPGLGTYRREE